MIPDRLLPQLVAISTRSLGTTRDGYGNLTASTTATNVVRGRLEQLATVELLDGRDVVTDQWRLYLPADTTIDAGDQVVESGRRFEVTGTPAVLWDGTGPHHIQAQLRYVGDVA